MKEDFIRVKTKGYPTLEDLAAEYDITMQELVEFHNARCSVVDLLSISFPKYLESVYMPADNYLTRQDITLASTQLRLQSITSDKEYGVHIKYSPKQLQIHYKIKVNRNQQKVTLFKERVFINNKGVERVVEQMFEKMDKTMYPLELMTTSNGKIDSIANDTEIVKRWKEDTLPKLKQYYQSEVSDDIIKKVDKAFTAIGENRDLLDRNLFYKLFFLPIYKNHNNFEHESTLRVYFSSLSQSIDYNIKYSLSPRYTSNDKIVLKIVGSEQENYFNQDREKGTLTLQYKLHRSTHEIYSIIGTVITYEDKEEYKINFQLFELNQ